MNGLKKAARASNCRAGIRFVVAAITALAALPCSFAGERSRKLLWNLVSSGGNLTERIETISAWFLGTPYGYSPLGEGPGKEPDPDPTFRLDLMDCETFVETTLALALASDRSEVDRWMRTIRYIDGEVDYRKRKHFTAAQWVPENRQLGLIEDITARVAGSPSLLETVSKKLDAASWQRRSPARRWPRLSPSEIPKGVFSLKVIPLGRLVEVARRIPSGSILLVVQANRPDMPVLVSHMGFVIIKEGKPFFRHASRLEGRVTDVPLERFVESTSRYRKWKVVGVNLQLPRRPK
ncbi:MAG: DUF1460 domain-containing protein [Deltaproteobacteria bacterium]|nr:MAG: DUF1460 domain-containing protein [Deltaproteobacteria bacterium]